MNTQTKTSPKLHKVLGVYFARNAWGNCFTPAVVLETNLAVKPWFSKLEKKLCYPAKLILTIRTRSHLETKFYWRGGLRFDWNSAHLARKFGTFTDTDFGGFHRWGKHMDL